MSSRVRLTRIHWTKMSTVPHAQGRHCYDSYYPLKNLCICIVYKMVYDHSGCSIYAIALLPLSLFLSLTTSFSLWFLCRHFMVGVLLLSIKLLSYIAVDGVFIWNSWGNKIYISIWKAFNVSICKQKFENSDQLIGLPGEFGYNYCWVVNPTSITPTY